MTALLDSTVSVIVPAYNHEHYIEQALRSVLEQDHEAVELIVVDDGSSDATAQRIEEILGRSRRPHRFLRQPNQGAHHAINAGLGLASGRFVTILNSDDYYHPRRLATLVRAAAATGAGLLFTRVQHVDTGGQPLAADHPMVALYEASLEASRWFPTRTFELLRYNFAITSGNLFLERSLFERIGPFRNLRLCHDWDFLLRAVLFEEPVFLEEALYHYRVHGANTILLGSDVKAVGDRETHEVRRTYLELGRQAVNPLAPCARNWGQYWLYFLRTFTNMTELG